MLIDNIHAGLSSQSPFTINTPETKNESRIRFVELEFKKKKLTKSDWQDWEEISLRLHMIGYIQIAH